MAITYRTISDDGPTVGATGLEYTLVLEAITTAGEQPEEVLQGSGIAYLSSHPRNLAAVCTSLDPQRHKEADDYFTITFVFTTLASVLAQNTPEQAANPDPTQRGFKFRFFTKRFERTLTHDNLGVPIRNRANDPYEHERTERFRAMQVQRNIPLNQFSANVEDYEGATNKEPYLGFDPREVLLDELQAEPDYENQVPFWNVNAVLIFSKFETDPTTQEETGGWVTRKLNAGYNELRQDPDGTWNSWPIILKRGHRPARPVLLDVFGRAQAAGPPGQPLAPVYLKFLTYKERDLNALNLFA